MLASGWLVEVTERTCTNMAPSSGNLSCPGRRKLVTATAALPVTLLLLLVLGLPGNPVAANPDAKRLYDDLLSNYNKLVRPVVNTTDVLKVCIKLKLSQLIDVVSGRGHSRGEKIERGGTWRKKNPQLLHFF